MRVWLVRYLITDQQGDHVIGIYDSYEEAEKARKKFKETTYLSSNFWTDIDEYELNKFHPESSEL